VVGIAIFGVGLENRFVSLCSLQLFNFVLVSMNFGFVVKDHLKKNIICFIINL